MSKLLKFALFFIFFNLISYASESVQTNGRFKIISSPVPDYFKFEKLESSPIGSKIIRIKVSNSYQYYSVDLIEKDLYFNTDTGITGGLYVDNNKFYYLVSEQVSLNSTCAIRPLIGCPFCLRNCDSSVTADNTNWFAVQARKADKYKLSLQKTCNLNENFNTETNECQKCLKGQSWDSENNRCYDDCSDVNKNMWGNTDGSCIDCSDKKTSDSVAECYCKFYGLLHLSNITADEGNGFYSTSCSDGGRFRYKDPTTPDVPKPDNNNTTPNNPGGGNTTPGGPGGGNGGPGGGSGGPGGGNGGSGGNGGNSGGGSGGQDNTNPGGGSGGNNNGNNQGGGNSGGGSGGSGSDNGKDKDAKFDPKDFDYNDIEKEVNGFKDTILKHYNEMNSKFDDFKRGYNQLINNIQGKGFSAIKGQSSSSSCPKAFRIDMGHNIVKTVDVDICKELSKLKSTFYYIFYLFFFCFFLFLTIKLTIPLMVNQFKYI